MEILKANLVLIPNPLNPPLIAKTIWENKYHPYAILWTEHDSKNADEAFEKEMTDKNIKVGSIEFSKEMGARIKNKTLKI